ncbi:hypothetical protein IMSAGC014_01066 [Bacteroidaceae bacterium]|uniref:hypothetical protein n=1 Tax=Prevotella sp. MGM2 TaxID=2033406 RepID=UPI000CE9D7DB|nr:hypothetical protein [Prevotella sp. MGM2]GAY31465.1 hypothetical protein PvtlMGM2_2318 [Prevotella sp. MGM2]GFI34571.1 hypothetical protein IMSAGC014_01066 [Bacteroidaceae bacterium]
MNKEEEIALQLLQTKVRQLILRHGELKRETVRLENLLSDKEAQIAELKEQNAQIKHDYDTLKTARVITLANNDVKETTNRLNRLIKEVDKCIALLNI